MKDRQTEGKKEKKEKNLRQDMTEWQNLGTRQSQDKIGRAMGVLFLLVTYIRLHKRPLVRLLPLFARTTNGCAHS